MGENDAYDVVGSQTKFTGNVIEVRVDDVRMSDGAVVKREIVAHPGAVAIVALDDEGRLVLVNQFRPAVRARPNGGFVLARGRGLPICRAR